jgi:hypothetical protein
MKILTSLTVIAVSFAGKVDAGLCFIIDGHIRFKSYFVVEVSECTLILIKYVHFSCMGRTLFIGDICIS